MSDLKGSLSTSGSLSGAISSSGAMTGALSAGIKDNTEIVQISTIYDLPNRGSKSTIYLITEDNSCYRWDESGSKYYCVGRDWQEITDIQGGKINE